MAKIGIFTQTGERKGEREISDAVFAVPRNDVLVHQVYVALTANIRQAIAHTKDRSTRAGSGKKPWKQKGTGRARAGSVRSPLWRKGGVTFGPTNERNFSKKTTSAMRQKATMIALSQKLRDGKLIALDQISIENLKTQAAVRTLGAVSVHGKSTYLALEASEKSQERAFQNIARVDLGLVDTLNVRNILDHEFVVLSEKGIAVLEDRFKSWVK